MNGFCVALDTKLLYESHIRSIVASASSKLGIMRKALCLFGELVMVLRWFWRFLFLMFEFCSSVWMSAAVSHPGLLDHVV